MTDAESRLLHLMVKHLPEERLAELSAEMLKFYGERKVTDFKVEAAAVQEQEDFAENMRMKKFQELRYREVKAQKRVFLHATVLGRISVSSVPWDHAEYQLSSVVTLDVTRSRPAIHSVINDLRHILSQAGASVVIENITT